MLHNERKLGIPQSKKGASNLFALPVKPIQNSFEGGFTKATLLADMLVILKSLTKSFRTIVECIAKRLVYAFQIIVPGHEDL